MINDILSRRVDHVVLLTKLKKRLKKIKVDYTCTVIYLHSLFPENDKNYIEIIVPHLSAG